MFKIFGRISTVALGVFAVVFGDVGELSAQATTFTACRVPDVGAIYMIGVAGAPPACLEPSHIQFSWTEGGFAGWEVVSVGVNGTDRGTVSCPSGKVVLGGGFETPSEYRFQTIANVLINRPILVSGNVWGWEVQGTSFPKGNWTIYAICASVG